MPAIIFSSVVFPQPFPPIRPTFSPRLSLKAHSIQQQLDIEAPADIVYIQDCHVSQSGKFHRMCTAISACRNRTADLVRST